MRVFWIFPRRWYYFGNLFLLKNLLFTNFKGNEKKKWTEQQLTNTKRIFFQKKEQTNNGNE
jgi:hypothetical protein